LAGKLDDIVGQEVLISAPLWNPALGGAMLLQCPAGPALGYAEGLSYMVNAPAAARRA